jgi:inosose dehydratase
MANIRFGCQTYTWQMSGEKYLDRLRHIMGVAVRAGFSGFEPEVQFLKDLIDPAKMREELQTQKIHLAAVCLVEDWLNPQEMEREKTNADTVIAFLKHFPDTVLCTCQMPGKDRNDLRDRQANLLACVNDVSRRAADQGITCAYHPNSPLGSIYRTADDYDILLNSLDESVTGWAPDVGHIAKGGMDPIVKMKDYRPLITHVHYKDMTQNGTWAQMGEGIIDFRKITSFLRDTGYQGWLIVEDECNRAEADPDGVTLEDGLYIKEKLLDGLC